MERTPVDSSAMKSVGFNPISQTLEVEFPDGDVYEYSGVSLTEYTALMKADSLGTYFNAHIKPKKRFRKVRG